jgi:predicted Zn-dependent protease with MMP-like domain
MRERLAVSPDQVNRPLRRRAASTNLRGRSGYGGAMQADEFEAAVQQVMDRLPEWVHQSLENVEIRIQDEPHEALGPDAWDLLGLYDGIPLTERSVDDSGNLPDVIYIFRNAHLEMNLPRDELIEEIATTLVHEIAHYFGIDDDHLDEIGWG